MVRMNMYEYLWYRHFDIHMFPVFKMWALYKLLLLIRFCSAIVVVWCHDMWSTESLCDTIPTHWQWLCVYFPFRLRRWIRKAIPPSVMPINQVTFIPTVRTWVLPTQVYLLLVCWYDTMGSVSAVLKLFGDQRSG